MSPFWKDLFAQLIDVVIVVATPILLMLAHKLVKRISQKWDLNLEFAQGAKLDDYIEQGLAYAREQTRKSLKQGTTLSGDDKRKIAVDYIAEAVKRSSLGELGADYIGARLEARLNSSRDPAEREAAKP